MSKQRQAYVDETVDSMEKDPTQARAPFDDGGNPVSRDRLIERVSEQDDGSPCRLPKV